MFGASGKYFSMRVWEVEVGAVKETLNIHFNSAMKTAFSGQWNSSDIGRSGGTVPPISMKLLEGEQRHTSLASLAAVPLCEQLPNSLTAKELFLGCFGQ